MYRVSSREGYTEKSCLGGEGELYVLFVLFLLISLALLESYNEDLSKSIDLHYIPPRRELHNQKPNIQMENEV